MNINIRGIVAMFATTILLSGCDLWGWGVVSTSEYNKVKAELDAFKKNPPKPEEVLVSPSAESCKTFIDSMPKKAADESCVAKTLPPAPVKKAIVTKRPAKPYINKHASGGKTLLNPEPVTPPAPTVPTARKPGGCIHTSDGTLVLKGTNKVVPNGNEVGRISDGDLRSSKDPEVQAILVQHPTAFVTNGAHIAMCGAWIALNAKRIQSQEGFQNNNDVHRTNG